MLIPMGKKIKFSEIFSVVNSAVTIQPTLCERTFEILQLPQKPTI